MSLLKTLGRTIPFVALLWGCSQETMETPADSQTHWLSSCEGDEDCGDLECICGYCTTHCAQDADCTGDGTLSCVEETEGAAQALCGGPAPGNVCLAECSDEEDCDSGQRCEDGSCVPDDAPGVGGSDDPDAGGPSNGNGGNGAGGSGDGSGGEGGSPPSNGGSPSPNGGSGNDSTLELDVEGDLVTPRDGYRGCVEDDDCVLVENTCSFCCSRTAIRADLVETYQENFATACMDYMGGVCDCVFEPMEALCVDQLCTAVAPSPEDEPRVLCEQSAGTWDPNSCGHYECGLFPECDAVIPGCNCGEGRTMDEEFGCLADPSCDDEFSQSELCEQSGGSWHEGSCGHYQCGQEPACEALIPGCDCGPGRNFAAGGCTEDPECPSGPGEDDEALCEATDGSWDDGSCGHYECGQRPACRALIPGCDCGELRSFEPEVGCMEDPVCSADGPEELCKATGGNWDEGSCGHYECGQFPACDAVIPGCNCGMGRNFFDDEGCVNDDSCEQITDRELCESTYGVWNEGSCGHYECGQEPACEALIPGCDCGSVRGFEVGFGCVQDPACGPTDEGLCEESGGTWHDSSCGHYYCGMPPDCAAVVPGCDCDAGANFMEGIGCLQDLACEAFE